MLLGQNLEVTIICRTSDYTDVYVPALLTGQAKVDFNKLVIRYCAIVHGSTKEVWVAAKEIYSFQQEALDLKLYAFSINSV